MHARDVASKTALRSGDGVADRVDAVAGPALRPSWVDGRAAPAAVGSGRLPPGARRMRGLSVIELLVGTAIALLMAASGVTLLTANLREDRALLVESRLMQDLRTAADVVTRDIRRAGYWGAAERGIWSQAMGPAASNPYANVDTPAPDRVDFRYSRDAVEDSTVDANERFGFRLRAGALEMLLGSSGWQALTDAGSVTVTHLALVPSLQEVSLDGACATTCPSASLTCPPRLLIRSVTLEITGRAAADSLFSRTIRSNVRLRNDSIVGACAT